MSNLEPLQCPKCGGYKVKDDDDGCLDIVLFFLTAGWWFIVILIKMYIGSNKPVKPGDKLRCDICGYSWVYKQ